MEEDDSIDREFVMATSIIGNRSPGFTPASEAMTCICYILTIGEDKLTLHSYVTHEQYLKLMRFMAKVPPAKRQRLQVRRLKPEDYGKEANENVNAVAFVEMNFGKYGKYQFSSTRIGRKKLNEIRALREKYFLWDEMDGRLSVFQAEGEEFV